MLLRLDLETQAYHDDADAPWHALNEPSVSRRGYVQHLVRTYGFEGPLEAALAYTPHVADVLAPRMRSGLLAQDLIALDVSPARLAHEPLCLIAPFPGLPDALGWLYVVARAARLQHGLLAHVRARHPELAHATTYLAASDAHARWRELGVALDGIARTPRIEEQVLAAAHGAFRCALDWYGVTSVRLGA
jgi:heme oxygenase